MTLTLLPLRTLFSRKAILPRRRRHEPFRTRLLAAERLETRAMLAGDFLSPWQNHALPADVTSDGRVTAMDALRIFNQLNTTGPRLLVGLPGSSINGR
jgi:Dockerin type I domain